MEGGEVGGETKKKSDRVFCSKKRYARIELWTREKKKGGLGRGGAESRGEEGREKKGDERKKRKNSGSKAGSDTNGGYEWLSEIR